MALRRLTFELSGRQRQDARPGLAKMYRVPPDRAWWPAVGAPLERGVRRHRVSQPRTALSLLRPEGKYYEFAWANVVVDVVMNSRKAPAPKLRVAVRFTLAANIRLESEQVLGRLKVVGDRARS